MKYIEQHWEQKYDGILYFFQRLEEMLFHYSDDIVRMPVHNTRTLILEYIQNEAQMKKGQVKSYQIDQILDELSNSIQSNKILIEKFGEEFVLEISNSIKKDKGDSVRYLYHKIPERTYYDWCIEYLKKQSKQHTHKQEIEFGIRSWISEIIYYGYSAEYVYAYLKESLSGVVADPIQLLDDFLDHFDLENKNYRVYFSFSPELNMYKELFASRMRIFFEDDGYFCHIKRKKKDFVGYLQIDALDRNKAAENAYKIVLTFIKYYRVISNRRRELVRLYATVKNEDSNTIYQIPVKSNGYRSIELEPQSNIEPIVDAIIIECQNKVSTTYSQLCKMVDLHNAAIEQHDLNDGFLNLWSILEIVSASIPSEAKIDKVIEGVLPILQKDYFPVVFANIDQDLKDNLTTQEYEDLVDTLTANGDTTNYISRFIFLPEYEKLREDYFKKLSKFPVIRHRIYTLWELRDSKSQIFALSHKYSQRVKWHIYRLYRTRNAIVHSGESSRIIYALGGHLHIYVDRILSELLYKLSGEETLQTITDVLIDTRLSLSKIKACFSENLPVKSDDLTIMNNSFFYSTINHDNT